MNTLRTTRRQLGLTQADVASSAKISLVFQSGSVIFSRGQEYWFL